MKRRIFINIAVIIALLLITVFVVWKMGVFEKKDDLSINNTEKIQNAYTGDEKNKAIEIALYFNGNSNEKSEIVKETRVISSDELLGEFIIQELLKGPAVISESKPLFPKETRLLSFSIKDGIANINLNSYSQFAMTESQEVSILKAIVTSLEQLTSVKKVMITVENQNVDTLGGNYSIVKPFGKEDIPSLKIQK